MKDLKIFLKLKDINSKDMEDPSNLPLTKRILTVLRSGQVSQKSLGNDAFSIFQHLAYFDEGNAKPFREAPAFCTLLPL